MNLITMKEVANLETDYEIESVDLTQEYWYPEADGESNRMLFLEVNKRKCLDQQSGESIELDCAVFIQPSPDGKHVHIANGSKRLVAVFENNDIPRGTAVLVTYKGKKKNKTNGYMSDHWSVQTLVKRKGVQ